MDRERDVLARQSCHCGFREDVLAGLQNGARESAEKKADCFLFRCFVRKRNNDHDRKLSSNVDELSFYCFFPRGLVVNCRWASRNSGGGRARSDWSASTCAFGLRSTLRTDVLPSWLL